MTQQMQNKQTYQPPKPLNVEVSQIIISLQKNLLIWVSNFEVKEMLKKMKKLKSYNNNNSLFFASLASSSILYPTYEEHFMAHQKKKRQARLCLGFSLYLLSNSPKHLPQFSPGYEGTENMFYFLNLQVLENLGWMVWNKLSIFQFLKFIQ